jgi:hypothetical protein
VGIGHNGSRAKLDTAADGVSCSLGLEPATEVAGFGNFSLNLKNPKRNGLLANINL